MTKVSKIFLRPAEATADPRVQIPTRNFADTVYLLDQRMAEAPDLAQRFNELTKLGKSIRSSEYHLTNACNLRCAGCWFFDHGHDRETRDEVDSKTLSHFMEVERQEKGINAALVIGGEPTLYPERLRLIVKEMEHVTISTNGLKRLPFEGFEKVAIGITLFGGGKIDDHLRAIRPNGNRFSGLFESALDNYHQDRRAGFVYALTEEGIDCIEDTVRKIHLNGNNVTFNYYYRTGIDTKNDEVEVQALLKEALRVKSIYPQTVISHPAFISAMITGKSDIGDFGYSNCPSISIDHPAHQERLKNGNPVLPKFNVWSADFRTIKFCCTSGHCDGCRDSQAIYSWLLVNWSGFLGSQENFQTWIEIAESYWRQFIWSPYHHFNQEKAAL